MQKAPGNRRGLFAFKGKVLFFDEWVTYKAFSVR